MPVIAIPLAFRRTAASPLHAADLPISHSRRTTRLPGSDDYSLNGSSPEISATSHTIRTVIAAAKRYSLAVMSSRRKGCEDSGLAGNEVLGAGKYVTAFDLIADPDRKLRDHRFLPEHNGWF